MNPPWLPMAPLKTSPLGPRITPKDPPEQFGHCITIIADKYAQEGSMVNQRHLCHFHLLAFLDIQ